MISVTPAQRECFEFIKHFISKNGYAPSVEEMRIALGVASKSNIHRILNCLEQRGCIRRLRYAARAIEVVEERPSLRRILNEEMDEIRQRMPNLAGRLERAMEVCNEPL